MAAAKKKPLVKEPTKRAVVGTRGGKRPNSGRVAVDGATHIITNSIGLTQTHIDFLEKQSLGKSAYIRKFLDKMINLEKSKAAKA